LAERWVEACTLLEAWADRWAEACTLVETAGVAAAVGPLPLEGMASFRSPVAVELAAAAESRRAPGS